MEEASLLISLEAMKGSVDALKGQVEHSAQLTQAKIEAFERENKQRLLFYDELIRVINLKIDNQDKRFDEFHKEIDKMDARIKIQELNMAKVLGFIVGTGIVSSGATVGILKLLGG